MVDQVLADARQIDTAFDPVRLQLSGAADARQHQELGRHQRAGGDDDLAVRRGAALHASGVAPSYAHCAAVLDFDALCLAMQANGQIGVAFQRSEKRVRGAASFAVSVHELVEADAALMRAVEVVVVGHAERLHALHEPARDIIDMAGVGDEQRTRGAVTLVEQPVVALHAAKVRQHIRPCPPPDCRSLRAKTLATPDSRRAGRAYRPARSPTSRRLARCLAGYRASARSDGPAARSYGTA